MDYDFFYRALNAGCTVFWGKRPVAVMAGDGLGSHRRYLEDRLREERLVQKNNENNVMWRAIQRVFHALYLPFKLGRGGGWKKTAGRRSQ